MEFLKKNKVVIWSLIAIILLIGSVFVWNYIVEKQKSNKNNATPTVDVSDVNNVTVVDSKLNGDDYKISQSYLLNYTKHKSSIWYISHGFVSKITKKDLVSYIVIKEAMDSDEFIIASIDSAMVDVKVGDEVNFVGKIDFKDSELHLSKISIDEITYYNVTAITVGVLAQNFKNLNDTYFVIKGYMVTDDDKYKLYDSKAEYNRDASAGNYFLLNWDNEFMYTGNQEVTVRCHVKDTYVLGDCSLIK